MRRWALIVLFLVSVLIPGRVAVPADFNGDGTDDVGVFRPSSGLWAIRGETRVYFGAAGDSPLPADFDGDGSADPAVFRPATGLWAIRGLTRVYFGGENCLPLAGDYDGDGTAEPALFQGLNGLWTVRGLTRFYYGRNGDLPAGSADHSALARVEYMGIPTMAPGNIAYVDWTGETTSVSGVDTAWSTSFTAQSGTRLYMSIGVPDAPGTRVRLMVNGARLLDIETQDWAGFDGCLCRDYYGNYYFEGTTWDE